MLRLIKFNLFCLLLLSNIAFAKQHLLILGDSLSAGYGVALSDAWATQLKSKMKTSYPSWQVVNASISGDTTANGLTRLPALLKKYNPQLVIIELGGNDGLRGLSLKSMKQNLATMIDAAEKKNAKVLLIGVRMPPNYGPVYTKAFQQVYHSLAKQYQLPLIPMFLDKIAGDPKLMQADGIHPNDKAQPQLLANVWPTLNKLLMKINKKKS